MSHFISPVFFFFFPQEDKVKKEKGVRVGEREDSLPPDYRFKAEDLKKLPAPEPEVKTGKSS